MTSRQRVARDADQWIKRGREYVQYEATCHDPQANRIFHTCRAHALDCLTRDVPKAATGIDSGAGGRLRGQGHESAARQAHDPCATGG